MRRLLQATGTALLILFVLFLSSPLMQTAEAASFIVNSTADTDDGSCTALNCTLREAINAANASGSASTITFSVSGTITLSSALPQVTNTVGLTISAQPRQVTISGNDSVQILDVASGARLTLDGLALVNANTVGTGGAINNGGLLTVTRCTFGNNHAYLGGAIYSDISTTENTWNVSASTFYQNSATTGGGAIRHGNGTANITNCTFAGNSAPNGAALVNGTGWTINVYYSTIAGNSASAGAIVRNASGAMVLHSSIVANPAAAANCSGSIQNAGNNLESGSSCGWGSNSGSLSDTDPLLRSLGNYGGATDTIALRRASPAIDAGKPADCPATDQRGIARPFGTACDMGSFEYTGDSSSTLPAMDLLLDD